MQVGTISKIFHDGEYGKITTRNGQEAHFHKGCLWNTEFEELKEGQGVEFEIQPSYKGHLAFQIRLYIEEIGI
ncbi:MAG: hypothetical protein A2Z88_02485 [Omnitrophica WOR_2 bacterium GWA2_47_8]|nr:MAG: hypothetical protein A2Z88_02485 [Omnitrophica WOR_2 bacterium GWA2_47_8]